MGLLSRIFGGNKTTQTVNQVSKNETEVNTAVTVENEIIIDSAPLAKAFDGIKQALIEFGILSAGVEATKVKAETETAAILGILEAKQRESIAVGLAATVQSIVKKAGVFIGAIFGIWALLKIISLIKGK